MTKITQSIIRMAVAFALFCVLTHNPQLTAQEPTTSAANTQPLSLEQVVDNLVRKNQERALALSSSEATRIYHVTYRGLLGDHEAEMTVEASFQRPNAKSFKIVSQSGSKVIVDRVLKKLLESEQEAARPEVKAQTELNRDNYEFEFMSYEPSDSGGVYALHVTPKSKSKYVYRGKIWVDGTDFAVVRIEAEPAQNPSFWIKKTEIHHEYEKVREFWLPMQNQSVSFIRMGGRATLTIAYKDYRVARANPTAAPLTMTSSNSVGSEQSPEK